MTARGVEFLYVPGNYYDTVLDRCGEIDENILKLKGLYLQMKMKRAIYRKFSRNRLLIDLRCSLRLFKESCTVFW